jgi:hypothetical protein
MIQGTADHLRAWSQTSRCRFGLRYSGVGDASMINPFPASSKPKRAVQPFQGRDPILVRDHGNDSLGSGRWRSASLGRATLPGARGFPSC